jgi:hypothetical protein
MVQLTVPLDKMGRFMGFMSALISIITPFGYLISGFLGEYLNIHYVIGATSLLAMLIMIFMWGYSNIGSLEPVIKEKLALAHTHAQASQQDKNSTDL